MEALLTAYQVYTNRDSDYGRKQAGRLLIRWKALLTAPELQVNCYLLLADIASKRHQHDSAAYFLRLSRDALARLSEIRSRYSEPRAEAIHAELHDDTQLVQGITLARASNCHKAFALLPSPEGARWPVESLAYLLRWTEALTLAGEYGEAHAYLQRAYENISQHTLNLGMKLADRLAAKI